MHVCFSGIWCPLQKKTSPLPSNAMRRHCHTLSKYISSPVLLPFPCRGDVANMLSSGVHPRALPNNADGTIDLSLLRSKVRSEDVHYPVTRLICLENTHNYCGGKVLPLQYLDQVSSAPLLKCGSADIRTLKFGNCFLAMPVRQFSIRAPARGGVRWGSLPFGPCLRKGHGTKNNRVAMTRGSRIYHFLRS